MKYTAENSQGIRDEQAVVEYLKSTCDFATVEPVTDLYLQRKCDIDVLLDGHPVSIKAMHTGLKHNNIGLELIRNTVNRQHWDDSDKAKAQLWFKNYNCYNTNSELYLTPSWYFTGTATHYLILQGERLRLYSKAAIAHYIAEHGFLYIKALSYSVLQQQGGINAWSGYLPTDKVPYLNEWKCPSQDDL
jgi:hypothetical protein